MKHIPIYLILIFFTCCANSQEDKQSIVTENKKQSIDTIYYSKLISGKWYLAEQHYLKDPEKITNFDSTTTVEIIEFSNSGYSWAKSNSSSIIKGKWNIQEPEVVDIKTGLWVGTGEIGLDLTKPNSTIIQTIILQKLTENEMQFMEIEFDKGILNKTFKKFFQ